MIRRLSMVLVIIAAAVAVVAQVPDERSLVAAWEDALRNDPDTLRLEPLGGGRYGFATMAFPYDGVLEINEVVIDDRRAAGAWGAVTGHVVVELVDADDELWRKHATSMGLWQSNNILMWDDGGDGWVGSSEWRGDVQGLIDRRGGWLRTFFWIGLLAAAVIALWLVTRRASRQMKRAMAQQQQALDDQRRAIEMNEQALELTRESNRLLARILDELERQREG